MGGGWNKMGGGWNSNGRRMELRPNDYNIPDTRVVSKLKIIDIFRNLKIMPMRHLIKELSSNIKKDHFAHPLKLSPIYLF